MSSQDKHFIFLGGIGDTIFALIDLFLLGFGGDSSDETSVIVESMLIGWAKQ